MTASMNAPSPCDRCGLRLAPYVVLKDGTTFRLCDLCYWGQVDSEGRETPEKSVLTLARQDEAQHAEAPLAAAA